MKQRLLFGYYLRIKGATGVAEVVGAAENKTGEDLLFFYALQSQLQVLSGARIICLHIVAEQAQHFHGVLQHTNR